MCICKVCMEILTGSKRGRPLSTEGLGGTGGERPRESEMVAKSAGACRGARTHPKPPRPALGKQADRHGMG